LFYHPTPKIEYTVRMKNEKTPQVHQKDCEACDQVITLFAPNDEVRFCFDCIEKVEAYERMSAEEELTIVHAFYAEPKV